MSQVPSLVILERFPSSRVLRACKKSERPKRKKRLSISPLPRLRRKHAAELAKLPDDDARAVRLAELNVHLSIDVLEEHPAIKRAINDRGLTVEGLIYDITTGHLKVLEVVSRKGGQVSNGLWQPTR